MPELAEVEVIRRNVDRWWTGRQAVEVRRLDPAIAKDCQERQIRDALSRELVEIRRRGKYLIAHLKGGPVAIFHFRMTGKIICADRPDPKYARLSWRIDEIGWLVFKDQRRLGTLEIVDEDELCDHEPLASLGPEPPEVTVAGLRSACSDRRLLKTALLDQHIVAGVGNIAVSEIFWRLQLPPQIKCGQLDADQWRRLVEQLPVYFDELVERTMADEVHYRGEASFEDDELFDVYGRQGQACPRCGGRIEKIRVAGRASYFCDQCQNHSEQ